MEIQMILSWILERLWWVFRGCLVLVNNLYCIPSYVVWMVLLLPLLVIRPSLYWRIEGVLFHWLLTMVAFWSYSANYQIVETGDDIETLEGEETLVLVNHQSTSDVPLLMAAFAARRNIIPHLNWIMDAIFKYTNFGIVSVIHGDFFIHAGRDRRESSIKDLAAYLRNLWLRRRRKWLVLFPEGGFLRKRRETSNKYCRTMALPQLQNVTLPRMGAIHAIIGTIGPDRRERRPTRSDGSIRVNHVRRYSNEFYTPRTRPPRSTQLKWIVDMTIGYPKGEALDLGAIMTGYMPPRNIYFHYKIYPINEVPCDTKGLTEWLYQCYFRKELLLTKFYESGIWPEPECRTVHLDLVRVLLLHLFYIFSSLTQLILLEFLVNHYRQLSTEIQL